MLVDVNDSYHILVKMITQNSNKGITRVLLGNESS